MLPYARACVAAPPGTAGIRGSGAGMAGMGNERMADFHHKNHFAEHSTIAEKGRFLPDRFRGESLEQ